MYMAALDHKASAKERSDRGHRVQKAGFRLLVWTGGAAAVAFVLGFISFASSITRDEARGVQDADGIVVLTGGPDRIADAFDLLASGHAKRLLITGVHPTTTNAELAHLHPQSSAYLNCCVDLDRRALNTAGNAMETRRWARANNYHKLIVVTSSWHMPRTIMELERRIPDVELIRHPVVPEHKTGSVWWEDAQTFRVLALEYVKYLAAVAGIRVAPRIAEDFPTASAKAAP